ncbi:hypothetical protein [Nocardioides mangrovi]|uniref:ARB-07466-like C-terminal domain-containing protein n=1 Tax=Nocardioides mangrovi TaxID=2874580 RepID=A0ABS7UHQ6_9ACTN|nr:hypothetical protein [Nocardioides mangrovi]MBZ5740568.1 hypothetical protein [Nocardioides mangrovi]
MRLAILTLLVLLGCGICAPVQAAPAPIEDYASYAAPTKCHPKPRAGTVYLARWVTRRFGGGIVSEGRACTKKDGPTSEHQTGQAFDWGNDVNRRADRRRVKDLMKLLFATDWHGNTDAVARRMGVMYVIWDDEIYSAWNGFRPERYLNSACKSRKKCSQTLRHRDHLHVSLDLPGARGRTSWFDGRL